MSCDYSKLAFEFQSSDIVSTLGENDFACFALWKYAEEFEKDILSYLNDRFDILLNCIIEWSPENIHSNMMRLYEVPILRGILKEDRQSGHTKKIHDYKFRLIIVKDKAPRYVYGKSVSNSVELVNKNIIEAKSLFRTWIYKATGDKFGVHSSNNIHEFYFQTTLLLGVAKLKTILEGGKVMLDYLKKDLEGADGWDSWKHLFETLRYSSNYIVLRNFEKLPFENGDKDLDVLTDNYQRFASCVALEQSKYKLYKGCITVESKKYSVDVRFVGDEYYDSAWEVQMLRNKCLYNNCIYVPMSYDYFFSLLYHVLIQKREISPVYVKRLCEYSLSLNLDFIDSMFKEKLLEVLRGYMSSMGFRYMAPLDTGVFSNRKNIRFIPVKTSKSFRLPSYVLLKLFVKKMIPNALIYIFK